MKTLILIVGLPGTGKSTACRIVFQNLKNCGYLDSDKFAEEQNLFEKFKKADTIIEKNLVREWFYDKKIEKIRLLFKTHKYVVLDAVFNKEELRKKFYKLKKENIKFIIIEIRAPFKIIKQRIFNDQSKGTDRKNGRWEAYLNMKKEWKPIKEKHFVIKSDDNFKANIKNLSKKIIDN